MQIASQSVEFRDHQRCLLLFAKGEGRLQFRPVLALPAFDFGELSQQFPLDRKSVV